MQLTSCIHPCIFLCLNSSYLPVPASPPPCCSLLPSYLTLSFVSLCVSDECTSIRCDNPDDVCKEKFGEMEFPTPFGFYAVCEGEWDLPAIRQWSKLANAAAVQDSWLLTFLASVVRLLEHGTCTAISPCQ